MKESDTGVGRKHRKGKEEASEKLSGGTFFLQLDSAPKVFRSSQTTSLGLSVQHPSHVESFIWTPLHTH